MLDGELSGNNFSPTDTIRLKHQQVAELGF